MAGLSAQAEIFRWEIVVNGVAFASLYEEVATLKEVVSDLNLAPLSKTNSVRIRNEIGLVNGLGLKAIGLSKKHNPDGRLQKKAIVGTLNAIARDFQAAEPILRGLQTGVRESHQIEVALNIRQALAKRPELKDSADQFLSDFCDQMNSVAGACRIAAEDISVKKTKVGQKSIDWYDDFTSALVYIAGLNGIRTTIETDRVTGKPKGPFLSLAAAFENLLYPQMRSPSLWAMAKRLSKSLSRVKKGKIRS